MMHLIPKARWMAVFLLVCDISTGFFRLPAADFPAGNLPLLSAPLPATNGVHPTKTIDPLVWDSMFKEYTARTNDAESHLKFSVTNVSNDEIMITRLRPSCGCTVARMPSNPWKLAPGGSGVIEITTDLRNKRGILNKTVTVESSAGLRVLQMKIVIPSDGGTTPGMQNRGQNLLIALADRQAIFHGECASCHKTPAEGKMGAALYLAACGICHDTTHRASMVPVLNSLNTSSNYWNRWITYGKTNSLMPGFAKKQGGPLTDDQIESLVQHLSARRN
jgi:cytochrome c553